MTLGGLGLLEMNGVCRWGFESHGVFYKRKGWLQGEGEWAAPRMGTQETCGSLRMEGLRYGGPEEEWQL